MTHGYEGRFLYVRFLLAAVAAGGVIAGLLAISNSVGDPIVRTRTEPAALLTSASTVADTRGRFEGEPSQSIPGEQLGLQGGTCDVYVLSDGGVLICHA